MKLTPRARQALESARQFAQELGHTRVGSQHIVFGLFQLGSGVHFHVLCNLGFTLDSLRRAIAGEASPGNVPASGPSLDISGASALLRAETEATGMSSTYTGTEHILLALLAEEHGGAAHLFASRGIDIAMTRQTILGEMRQTSN